MYNIPLHLLVDHYGIGNGIGAVRPKLEGGKVAHQVGVELTILLGAPRKGYIGGNKLSKGGSIENKIKKKKLNPKTHKETDKIQYRLLSLKQHKTKIKKNNTIQKKRAAGGKHQGDDNDREEYMFEGDAAASDRQDFIIS
jgi:hypothetical protein